MRTEISPAYHMVAIMESIKRQDEFHGIDTDDLTYEPPTYQELLDGADYRNWGCPLPGQRVYTTPSYDRLEGLLTSAKVGPNQPWGPLFLSKMSKLPMNVLDGYLDRIQRREQVAQKRISKVWTDPEALSDFESWISAKGMVDFEDKEKIVFAEHDFRAL
ncbi:hypothetical protein HDU93_002601, partial [Gonapodya sp. JEL0774]